MRYQDRPVPAGNGFLALTLLLGASLPIALLWRMAFAGFLPMLVYGLVVGALLLAWSGLFVVNPRQGRVMLFFGRYVGVWQEEGFWWTNPFYVRRAVSTQTNNFETAKLKVNDASGSPIEIAAVVVYRVRDLANALLAVDNYDEFLRMQAESALREIASSLPYSSRNPEDATLVTAGEHMLRRLREEIQSRVEQAGIEIEEARVSHLAYAPEIASAMLQVQQARALLDARKDIVLGATSMTDDVIAHFRSQYGEAAMTPAVQAELARALMVVLCSAREAQPTLNVG